MNIFVVKTKEISKKKYTKMRNNKGLSLVEIIIVMTIMAILASVVASSFVNSLRRSRDARRQSDLEKVRGALQIYHTDFDFYFIPVNAGIDDFIEVATELDTQDYMNSIPADPKTGTWDYFYSSATGDTYQLCAFLEGPVVTSECAITGTPSCNSNNCNYCTCNP